MKINIRSTVANRQKCITIADRNLTRKYSQIVENNWYSNSERCLKIFQTLNQNAGKIDILNVEIGIMFLLMIKSWSSLVFGAEMDSLQAKTICFN